MRYLCLEKKDFAKFKEERDTKYQCLQNVLYEKQSEIFQLFIDTIYKLYLKKNEREELTESLKEWITDSIDESLSRIKLQKKLDKAVRRFCNYFASTSNFIRKFDFFRAKTGNANTNHKRIPDDDFQYASDMVAGGRKKRIRNKRG